MQRLRSHNLAELTSPEIAEALSRGIDTVILPVGSTEQHGAHLPLSTDSLHTVAVLERVAESLPALVAPLIPVGRADHHMAFPGTITVRHETLHATVRDWCDSFFRHGFRHVLDLFGPRRQRRAARKDHRRPRREDGRPEHHRVHRLERL